MQHQKQVILISYDQRTIARSLSLKLQLGLTGESITNPTAETSQQIFTQFARIILNVPEHSLTTLPMSAGADHDNDLHRKSIPLIIVYQSMKAFIEDNSGGKLSLSMCDLVNPSKDPQKFKRLTSFLHDFIRLHEYASPIFNEICEEFSDQKQEMELIKEELAAAEKRKNDLVAKQASRKRRENELMKNHNELKTELNNVVNQYMKNSELSNEIDKQTEEACRQVEEVERETITGKKTIEYLTEEVLSSPEELKQEMAQRKKHIEELKECLKISKQALQLKQEARDICINAEKNVPVVTEKIEVWAEVRDDILDLMDSVEENVRKLNEMQEDLALTANKKAKANEQMVEQSQMHEQLRKEHLQRTQELQANIEEITRKIAGLGKNQPEVSRENSKKQQELIAVKNAHSETVAKIINSIQDSVSKFQKLEQQFRETQKSALEKRNAVQRANDRLRAACVGRLPSDYTFSTSSLCDSENHDPLSPIAPADFNVFK
ncbi:unnamed protein product [Caenorhabditis brenneri]